MRKLLSCSIGLVALMALGCEKKQSTPVTPTAPAPGSAAVDAQKSAGEVIQSAGEQVQKNASAAQDQAKSAVDSGAVAEAQKLLDQATQYIKENKLDLAEKALVQLDKMKGSLPSELQSAIEAAHSSLKAAKLHGGQLPGMGR